MSTRKVFVSHITEDAPLALILKEFIEEEFLQEVTVFASSNVSVLTPGEEWLKRIKDELKNSSVLLIICTPEALSRPWINFEAGCSWILDKPIIPLCLFGQEKHLLPFPFSTFQAVQKEENDFEKNLMEALTLRLKFRVCPRFKRGELTRRLDSVRPKTPAPKAPLQLIHSSRERTKLIINDLSTLLKSAHVDEEKVWSSAFLSTLAIGADDPYPPEDEDYLDLLLQEKKRLIELAEKGCNIRFIISPANPNNFRETRIEYAMKRTETLLKFLKGDHLAHQYIDWSVSELAIKNLYIIGHIAVCEGYKKGSHGYGLTLRHTARQVINAHREVYQSYFRDLAAHTLVRWPPEPKNNPGERELLRLATIKCLEESLNFLREKIRNKN